MSEQLPGSAPVDPTSGPVPDAPTDGLAGRSGGSRLPEPPDDEPFLRLRAADPASGAVPDAPRLAATLRAATGVPVGADAVTGAASRGPALESAHRRWGMRGTPARWLQVAAVVAALAVVGGGGYALGNRTGGSSTAGAGTTPLPAIALGGAERSGGAVGAPAVGAATSGSGSSSSVAVGRSGMAVWWGSRTTFAAQGLATTGGTGAARAFDAASVVSADTVRRAAKVLGVSGEPRAQWGTWTVGALDGTGAVLTLSGDGMATLSFSDPAWDPWTCSGDKASAKAEVCNPGAAAAPTGDAAISKVRKLLTSLGVDLTGATAQAQSGDKPVQDSAGTTVPTAAREMVTFSQVIDGQLTGISWSATLVGSGVQSLWGPLAPLTDLGTYQVVSPAAAVDRLNDPRFGSFGSGPMPLAGTGVAESGVGVATPGAVAPDAVGSSDASGSAAASSGTASSGAASSGTAPGGAATSSGTASSGTASSGTATAGPGTVVAPAPAVTAVPGGTPVPEPSSTVPPVAPTTPKAGSAIAWPVRHVTIVSARLGLAVTTLPSGAAVLVPTYQLTDTDGGTWSVIAVADSQLDLTAAG